MSKIVNLLRNFDKETEVEFCSANIYSIIYEVEEKLNISNIIINLSLYNIINKKKELINLEIKFKNVTDFSLQNVSGIINISGFEILDHKEDGWSIENRYEVHDFENGDIHFMCQEFDIKQL